MGGVSKVSLSCHKMGLILPREGSAFAGPVPTSRVPEWEERLANPQRVSKQEQTAAWMPELCP